MSNVTTKLKYYCGLDLGQAQDYTALAVVEKTTHRNQLTGELASPSTYAVRHLERYPLGTAYTEIITRLSPLFLKEPLKDCVLAIDRTGVGRPVVDMIKKAKFQARLYPITITGGHTVHDDKENGGWNVPKKDLVGAMQVLLQSQRIKIASSLAEADTLKRELQNFQVKVTTAANEQFGAWREGTHDDLVLAVALAVWSAEKFPEFIPVGGLPTFFESPSLGSKWGW
jgi:hypothetical protein